MTRILHVVIFAVGLAAAYWIGAGYVASNPLALAVTTLVGAVYLLGGLELYRYQQATASLTRAAASLSEPPARLADWLEQVHPSLRNAVRLRVEGERVGLPGPVLTSYLVGLLVLLGMLGTFLGMVATLRGTGLALESSTNLEAIRASLAAPVKGLGFAFGTSVAGVATSAMLGLLAALCRRERIRAAQLLDAKIATTLRVFSLSHQREEGFRLLQQQAEIMPTVVDRLQAMMATIETQNQALNHRLVASQDTFHSNAEAAYSRLAASVEQSLKQSVVEGARSAGTAIQPVVEATMAGLARETAALHDTVTQAVQQQLDGLSTRFERTTVTVADLWKDAVVGQQRATESLTTDLRLSLDGFAHTFEQRSSSLMGSVSDRLDGVVETLSQAWDDALSRQERASETLAGANQLALSAAGASFAQQSASLVSTMSHAQSELRAQLAAQDEQRLAAWTETLGAMTGALRQEWDKAGASAASRQQDICDVLAQTASAISADTKAHASHTIAEIDRLVQVAAEAPKAAAALQVELAAQDQQRLSAWTESLGAMAATLRQEWQQAGANTASRQQDICEVLAQTASTISAEAKAHASHTIAEIERLLQVAADAPKAAAALQVELAAQDQQRLSAWTESLGAMAATLRQEWQQAGANTASRQQDICEALAQTASTISSETKAHASHTIAEIERLVQVAADAPKAAAALQVELAAQDQQRLSAWTESLGAMAATLRQEWQQAGANTASRQQDICEALAQTASTISSETKAHASHTIAEIERLVQVAADAPKAAAALQVELAAQDQQRLSAWTESLGAMAATLRQEWQQAGANTASRQQDICEALAQTASTISSETKAHASHTIAEIERLVQVAADAPKAAAALQVELAAQDQQRLSAWTESLGTMAATLRQEWQQAGANTASHQQEVCEALTQTASTISAEAKAHASHTIAEIERLVQVAADAPKAAAALQVELAAQDQQRLSAWTESLREMSGTLRQEWEQAGVHTASRQQEVCEALAHTASTIASEMQAHASNTITEIAQLVQAASEAPRAAADVVTEVRQKLSDSMARDNVMLEERSRLLETLGTLLDAVNHASSEQRTAVDALVATSASVLDRVGTQFTDKVAAETDKLADVAAQVTGSAVDVASLGDAFGMAVQLFSQSSESLVGHLERIEAALDKSMARSDEQLAYYVAQAREVIDLSMMTQKQIVEDLQQFAGERSVAGNVVA